MQVTYDKKSNKLTIEMQCMPAPVLSSSEATFLVASEASPYGIVEIHGKPVRIQVNAMFKNPDAPAKGKK